MIFNTVIHIVEPIIQKIKNHPFNQELALGTLPQEKFMNYLQQDAMYLKDFSKALAIASTRLSHTLSAHFLKLALSAIEAEQQLHQNYLKAHPATSIIEKNPACFAYTHYLLSTASLSSVEEAIASLLPCFWIYQIVGEHIAATHQTPNPYQDWINTYSSEAFKHAVNGVIDITNTLAEQASDTTQQQMLTAFKCASELEWLFWDDAYHQRLTLSERIAS